MSLIKLEVRTNNQKYPILIGNSILNKLHIFLKENYSFNNDHQGYDRAKKNWK